MRPTFDRLADAVSEATSVPRDRFLPARGNKRAGAVFARKILLVLCDRHLVHLSSTEIANLMGYTDQGTRDTNAHSVVHYHRRRIRQHNVLNEPLLFEFVEQIEAILAANGESE